MTNFQFSQYHIVNTGALGQIPAKNVLYAVRQHAVFLIDDLMQDVLSTGEGCTKEETLAHLSDYPPEAVQKAIRELESVLNGPPAPLSWPKPWSLMKLHISHECNLRCRYCFAWHKPEQGMYSGNSPEMMTQEIAFAAVDRLLKSLPRDSDAVVTLHGGEPLMNWPLIKSVVEFGKSRANELGKNIEFAIATNAIIFRPEIAFFFASTPVQILVSLDGDEVCNAARVFPNGKPAFELILKNIRRYQEAGCKIFVEATVHHENIDLVKIARFIKEQGAQSLLFNHNRSCGDMYSLTELDMWQLMRQYDKLIRWERWNSGPNTSFFVRNLSAPYSSLSVGKPILSHCPLGTDGVSIAPDGEAYVCELFMDDKAHTLGNVREEKIGYELEYIRELMVDRRERCKDCWARFLCGGPCAHEALIREGSIEHTPEHICQLHQSIAEGVVTAYAYQGLQLPEQAADLMWG